MVSGGAGNLPLSLGPASRLGILQLSLVAIAVMIATSILMARNIAQPIRALADAADDARMRAKGRVDIPDFGRRRDEIGELSNALTAMTGALYDRIDAIAVPVMAGPRILAAMNLVWPRKYKLKAQIVAEHLADLQEAAAAIAAAASQSA